MPPALLDPRAVFYLVVVVGFVLAVAGLGHDMISDTSHDGGTMYLVLVATGLLGAITGGVWNEARNRRKRPD